MRDMLFVDFIQYNALIDGTNGVDVLMDRIVCKNSYRPYGRIVVAHTLTSETAVVCNYIY